MQSDTFLGKRFLGTTLWILEIYFAIQSIKRDRANIQILIVLSENSTCGENSDKPPSFYKTGEFCLKI